MPWRAGVLLSVCAGCSLFGARVPDKPPLPERCPEGVVIADVIGTGFFLLPPTVAVIDGLANGWPRDNGAIGLVIFGIPMAIVGSVYLGSTIYGFRARSRCDRLKNELAEAVATEQRKGPPQRVRPPQVGEAPMHCAITEPDAGECFIDEAACKTEAERGGGACEPRTATWCFDMQDITASRPQTTCAASLVDCDARRIPFTADRTMTITTCGSYAVQAAQ